MNYHFEQDIKMKLSTCIYTKEILELEESWCAIPTTNLLHRLQMAGQESNRWVAVLPNGMKIALGDPIRYGTQVALVLPSWFHELCGFESIGTGEEVEIKFEKSETLPKCKSLTLQILGTLPDWLDPVEVLEGPLSQLGVLQVGQIIPIPLFDNVHILVMNCGENDTPYFLDGETALHIEQDIPEPTIPEPSLATPSPIRTGVATSNPFESKLEEPLTNEEMQESLSGMFERNSIAPPTPTPTPTGRVLGGDPSGRSRLLDLYGKK